MAASGRTGTIRGALAALVLAVLGAALLAGCGGAEEESVGEPPPRPREEASIGAVVIRISGTEGTSYSVAYGLDGEQTGGAEGTLGAEPEDHEVLGSGDPPVAGAVVAANARKTEPGEGKMKVEILENGEVVAREETSEELGALNVTWEAGTGNSGER